MDTFFSIVSVLVWSSHESYESYETFVKENGWFWGGAMVVRISQRLHPAGGVPRWPDPVQKKKFTSVVAGSRTDKYFSSVVAGFRTKSTVEMPQ